MSCNSYTSGTGVPLIYHIALLVGANHVGYIVACGGGIIRRMGCQPLSTGQVLHGSIRADKLSLEIGNKTKNYKIETSSYIGPLTANSNSHASPGANAEQEQVGPSSGEAGITKTVYVDTHSTPQPEPQKTATVMFSSEPTGAEIYIDGAFAGNTPSMIQVAPGPHEIRIEVKGHSPWSRSLKLSSGDKITLNVELGDAHP